MWEQVPWRVLKAGGAGRGFEMTGFHLHPPGSWEPLKVCRGVCLAMVSRSRERVSQVTVLAGVSGANGPRHQGFGSSDEALADDGDLVFALRSPSFPPSLFCFHLRQPPGRARWADTAGNHHPVRLSCGKPKGEGSVENGTPRPALGVFLGNFF